MTLSGWPQHCTLRGHKGQVTCLLYPSSHSSVYDRDLILSGGADFTVKLWNLYSGVLVHTFAVHGGKVKDIISCPPDINVSCFGAQSLAFSTLPSDCSHACRLVCAP